MLKTSKHPNWKVFNRPLKPQQQITPAKFQCYVRRLERCIWLRPRRKGFVQNYGLDKRISLESICVEVDNTEHLVCSQVSQCQKHRSRSLKAGIRKKILSGLVGNFFESHDSWISLRRSPPKTDPFFLGHLLPWRTVVRRKEATCEPFLWRHVDPQAKDRNDKKPQWNI